MIDLKDLTITELKAFFQEIGEKPFRAKQVFSWIYRGTKTFDEMTDLSKEMRNMLKHTAQLGNLEILRVQASEEDGTRKYLLGLRDGNAIESVFMKYKYGNSICVSSQAGCRMGCGFCASGMDGLKRNLTPGEIADQILTIRRDTGEKINRVVVMGTGEPFDNYDNVLTFLNNIHSKSGLDISMRNITVSTCGLVPQIEAFARDMNQVNLAVSLHSADDAVREAMMPINKRYPVDQLLGACKQYTAVTGRRVTFEYALVKGKNDSMQQIDLLRQKLKGVLCHVNLIPLNEVKESGFWGSNRKRAGEIAAYLQQRGIPATVRRELGSDIQAACGQLRLAELRKV